MGTEKKGVPKYGPNLGPTDKKSVKVRGQKTAPPFLPGSGTPGWKNEEHRLVKCSTYMPHERQPDQQFCVPQECKESGHSMSHDDSKTGPPGGPKIGPQTAKANNGAFQFAGLFWGPPGGPILGPLLRVSVVRWVGG